jgi:cysteine desulfurase
VTLSHPRLAGRPIYLDYNATTPVDPQVAQAALPYLHEHFGNPSSAHPYGDEPRAALTRARTQLADLLAACADAVVFTGSGSEADALAIQGVIAERRGARILIQPTEHPAILETCHALARRGDVTVAQVPVDAHGLVQPAALAAVITPDTVLVSIMHANNETGVVQPIAELARIAHAHGALFHTDAAQTVGKLPIRVEDLGVDLLTVAGHKLYAPKGVGALYVRPGIPIAPLVRGGGQERGMRAGTENVALIAALGAAAAIAAATPREAQRLQQLRDRLHHNLHTRLGDRLHLNGHPERRLPNTLNVSIDGVDGRTLLAATPAVAASTGSACHAGDITPSPVLTAMGLPAERCRGAIRLSVGRYTSSDDVDRAADLLASAAIRCGQALLT